MIKGKLKLPTPNNGRKVFPDRLGSLVSGFEGSKEVEIRGSVWEIEMGEELEPIPPNALGFDREKDVDNVYIDEDVDTRVRLRPNKDAATPVLVLKSILVDEKRSDLEYELSQKEINLEKLQRIASTGIPNGGSLRATTWKLLLGYLPSSHELWEKELKASRQKYANLKEELLLNPVRYCWLALLDTSSYILLNLYNNIFGLIYLLASSFQHINLLNIRQSAYTWKKDIESSSALQQEDSDADGRLTRHEISQEDHPLSLGKANLWQKYFQLTEMVEQIDRDLLRTHPDLPFFSGESSFSRKNREAMKNILLLFAKLNPAIRYVQGMNEILAPIYYVFSTDTDKENAANAEADSFFCFVRILSDSVDHFCQQLDNSSGGILSTLSRLSDLLKVHDVELWHHLEFTTKVKPQYYGFRWITLLLTQEFNFQSIFRIWDTLLSNPFGVQDMLLRICCAMLLCVKAKLLSGDFVANLKLLQHYPGDMNIEYLLQVAQDISPDTSFYC